MCAFGEFYLCYIRIDQQMTQFASKRMSAARKYKPGWTSSTMQVLMSKSKVASETEERVLEITEKKLPEAEDRLSKLEERINKVQSESID